MYAMLEQRTAVLAADEHGTDAFREPHNLDDSRQVWKSQLQDSHLHDDAVVHVVVVLRSGMDRSEHRIVLLQQCTNADSEEVSILG